MEDEHAGEGPGVNCFFAALRSAPKTGDELKRGVADVASKLGGSVQTKVRAGRRLWGQKRYMMSCLMLKKAASDWPLTVNSRLRLVRPRKKYLPQFKLLLIGRSQVLWSLRVRGSLPTCEAI